MIKRIPANEWFAFTPITLKNPMPLEELSPHLNQYVIYCLQKEDVTYLQVRQIENLSPRPSKPSALLNTPVYKAYGKESAFILSDYLYQCIQNHIYPNYEAIQSAEEQSFIQQAIEFEVKSLE